MKKLSYFLLVAAGLMIASCSNENPVTDDSADGSANVTISLDIPQIGTRTYSDGTTASQLQYAVYVKNSDNSYSLLPDQTIKTGISLTKQVNFKLVTGRTYGFVFWAGNSNAPYNVVFGDNGAEMHVGYKTNNGQNTLEHANNENLDAFYAFVSQEIRGDTEFEAHLYRPFAQINVGTNDYENAKKSGFAPATSHIKVSEVYSTLNLISGEVSNPVEGVDFVYNVLPVTLDATSGAVTSGETFPVDGYDYMAMAYALVDFEDDQPLVTVEFDCTDGNNRANGAYRNVENVPVKRNYRTNIYGQLFTSNVDVNVIIEPVYEEQDQNNYHVVLDSKALRSAIAKGGNIKLDQNITIGSTETSFVINKNTVIDLNGFNITSNITTFHLFLVENGAEVTLKGEGVISTADYAPFGVSDGILNIEDATLDASANHSECILLDKGTVNISGGLFKAQAYNGQYYTLNCLDTAYADGSANFIVTGGTFVNFNPAESQVENPVANYVAEGYKVESEVKDGDTYYTVVKDE